jgi:quinol monooxygenase YgiN
MDSVAEHASVIRILRLKPAAGKRDELMSRLAEGAEDIRKREGCFGVQVCSVRETPDELAVISRWASQSALDAFVQASEPQRGSLYALAAGAPVIENLTPI